MSRALLSSVPRRSLSVGLAAGLLGGLLVGFAAGEERVPEPTPVAAAELERTPLPAGDPARGRAGVERSALDLAAALDAVPLRPEDDDAARFCPANELEVRWEAPLPGEFAVGGHIDPVGPVPTDETIEVNGLVVCAGSSYAYMGFEARWTGVSWSVAAVPSLSDEHELEGEAHEGEPPAQPPAAPRTPAPAPRARGFAPPAVAGIDPYAAYDPQRVCDPVAKPGTVALRDLLLRTHPGTRTLGISRTCAARGTSEHKEGRAFDWGVRVDRPQERAAAEGVLQQLLATDSAGHRHALARRLGVMYLIWDRQIWSSYSAERGWRPYGGANAHTDHVHLSLSWDGAMGRTSYWRGGNAALLTSDPEVRLVRRSPGNSAAASAPRRDRPRTTRWQRDAVAVREERAPRSPRPTSRAVWAERAAAWEERRRAERDAARKERRERQAPVLAVGAVVPQHAVEEPAPERTRVPRPERTSSPEPRAERTPSERPRAERSWADTSRTERPRAERSSADKPRSERPRSERPRAERSWADKPRSERPRSERPRAERSWADKPRTERPRGERPRRRS